MISIDYLNECVEVRDGNVFWRKRPRYHFETSRGQSIFNGRYAGKIAGNEALFNGKRYRKLSIDRKNYLCHRVVLAIINREWPIGDVDHIDGNGLNNSPDNLRVVSSSQNGKNAKLICTNTSGVMGVSFMKSKGKWRARIQTEGRQIHIGMFEKFEDAVVARREAEKRYEFHENHGRVE